MENIDFGNAYYSKDKVGNILGWVIEEGDAGYKTKAFRLKNDNTLGNYKEYYTPVRANSVRTIGQQIDYEIKAKIKRRVNDGFLTIVNLFGDYVDPKTVLDTRGVYYGIHEFLTTNYPKHKTDRNGFVKPMLARTYKPSRPNKFPRIGQPKINGIRCTIRWGQYSENDGLFKKTIDGPILSSREGNRYRVPNVEKFFNDKQLFLTNDDQMLIYDGELYMHGESLNNIKASVPMYNDKGTLSECSGNTDRIRFIAFDIAIEMSQTRRLNLLEDKLHNLESTRICFKGYSPVNIIESVIVNSEFDLMQKSQHWINNGFEGAISRDMFAVYQYGVRGKDMEKIKQFKETECKVINIIPKPKEPETGLFVLKNDINDEIFECNPMGTYSERKNYLDNKDANIGKLATVKFYERSGVKKCPFHANVVTIRDYE